ncbi:hypothetical protein [Terribacillus sp. DMT04]|uniref:hypothetical protein n=1 Tax=Terribacillus sp. DMT04 TaxID=2850441 RepID=UPI001C2C4576|nr:hypothetical protein [Terribacillus sp. DMT04]QXE00656.1 hypothetical protein KS242_11565 [Terribacillus sp. DMT04]
MQFTMRNILYLACFVLFLSFTVYATIVSNAIGYGMLVFIGLNIAVFLISKFKSKKETEQ